MSSRIVVFPVMGRRWAFTSVLPNGGTRSGAPTPLMSWSELFKTLRTTPSTSEKLDTFTNYASDKMHQQWVAMGVAKEGSIRKRLHIIGERMLSRLGPTESFLKAFPKDAGLVEIVYPNCSLNPRLVRRRVRHLASSGEVIHRNYTYGSVALLPFSLLFGILPFPNVVLAWNLFRAYSHWRALQGSRRLRHLVTDSPSEISSLSASATRDDASPETDGSTSANTDFVTAVGKEDRTKRWVFLPSEFLETLLVPANVPREPISDVTVSEICKEYLLDPHEILKWRDQKLPIKSFE
ncbi:unnamed protein product [Calypogeia fissa]